MKIVVAGTRGIPDIPGGVETHCQELYPKMVPMGASITICRRSTYIKDKLTSWSGLHLVNLPCPRSKSFEAIIHTILAVCYARYCGAHIVHIHSIGPALVAPLARLLGLSVVFTHHGADYQRQKWGKVSKTILKLGEQFGCMFANRIIAISPIIKQDIARLYNKDAALIPNGVSSVDPTTGTQYLDSLRIKRHAYILTVARLVPEKGISDLIAAFNAASIDGCTLLICGDSDHNSKYASEIRRLASKNPNIVMTGYITGEKLAEVFSNARSFVLPSYHEGLPIALLEAMSYGLNIVASDIPANRQIPLDSSAYFPCKDISALSGHLKKIWEAEPSNRQDYIDIVRKDYSWHNAAKLTFQIYMQDL